MHHQSYQQSCLAQQSLLNNLATYKPSHINFVRLKQTKKFQSLSPSLRNETKLGQESGEFTTNPLSKPSSMKHLTPLTKNGQIPTEIDDAYNSGKMETAHQFKQQSLPTNVSYLKQQNFIITSNQMQATNAKKFLIQQQIQQNLSRPTSTGSKKTTQSNAVGVSRVKIAPNEGTLNVVRKVNLKSNPASAVRSPPTNQYMEMSPQPTSNQPKQSVISINMLKIKRPAEPQKSQMNLVTPEQPQMSGVPSSKVLNTILSAGQIKATTLIQKQRVNFSPQLQQQTSPLALNSEPVNSRMQKPLNQVSGSGVPPMSVLSKQVKQSKRYGATSQDAAQIQLQSNLKAALQQLSDSSQGLKQHPNGLNKIFNDILSLHGNVQKQALLEAKRSHSEKTQSQKQKQQLGSSIQKKKKTTNTTTSVGSTQSNGFTLRASQLSSVSNHQRSVKISKPTFNVQINNNVGSVNSGIVGGQNLIDPVQFLQAINNAAQLSQKLNKAQQKRTSSEDNVNQQKNVPIADSQHQSQKSRKNAPSLAGSDRGQSQNSSVKFAKKAVPDSNHNSQRSLNEIDAAMEENINNQQVHKSQQVEGEVVLSGVDQIEKLVLYIKNYIKKTNELPPTTLEFYKFIKLIGKGAFGKVTLGVHILTGKQVAIKTIEKQFMKDDFSKRKVFQEVYLLKKIRHSNVIRLLEVFESQKHLLIVMEYAGGGDLLKLIKQRGKLDENDAKYIFKQIVYGIAHIHCRSVIHRDIKLDNILLDSEKGVKICDFGVSKIIKKGQQIKEQCGTPAYLAPEIILDQGYEGFFVDIWSLGVLLFAMLSGTVPFKASNLEDLHKLILAGVFTLPETMSQDAQNLILAMIKLVPTDRLTVPQILAHAWLKETNDDSDSGSEQSEDKQTKQQENDLDMDKIQGNVNYVNVDNLFYNGHYKTKLSYTDYCCVTEDFATENINEEALRACENFGFPRQFLVKCLNRGDINHATACYFLLTNSA